MPNSLPSILDLDTLYLPPIVHAAPAKLTDALAGLDLGVECDIEPLFIEGLPYEGRATRVFAYRGMPSVPTELPCPGIVLVHGGGGTAYADWVRLWNARGYAAIAVDLDGCVPIGEYNRWTTHEWAGPSGIVFPGTGAFIGIDQPIADQWHTHALAAVISAHSHLAAQPGVDENRIGLTGISWGGYLACLVAGVDQRLKFVAPVYGCGYVDDCPFFAAELNHLTLRQREKWLELWDPRHTLPDATMPFHWVTGTNDFAYPLPAVQNSQLLIRGSVGRTVKVRMRHGHDGPGETPSELRVFADSIMSGSSPLPQIVSITREGNRATATFAGSVPVKRAELIYALSADPDWQMRHWETLPADVDVTHATVGVTLPDGVVAWMINVIDTRDCIVSSPVQY